MKHKIYIHEDLTGETLGWNLDIESFQAITVDNAENLRERLISMDVGLLDIKYLNKSTNNQSELEEFNIIV